MQHIATGPRPMATCTHEQPDDGAWPDGQQRTQGKCAAWPDVLQPGPHLLATSATGHPGGSAWANDKL